MFAFELKMLERLGQQPDFTAAHLAPGTKEIARALTRSPWDAIARLRLSEAQSDQLRRFLHGFLIYHLERIPPSRTAALNTGNWHSLP